MHISWASIPLACADPESFVRGCPFLTMVFFLPFFLLFFLEGRDDPNKYHYKRALIGLPAKRHLNGVSLACQLWPKIECWYGSL